MRELITCLLFWTIAPVVFAQAVTEWRTANGVAVAVVETPAGDLEHIAAVLPADVAAPPSLLGFPTVSVSLPAAQVVEVAVPAGLASLACIELSNLLKASGAASVVALGPAPARELRDALAGLDAAPWRPLATFPCAVADGVVEVVRGAPERIELTFASPGLAEQKAELLPAVEAWLEQGLAVSEPGARVELAREGGCQKLVVRRDVTEGGLLDQARHLREALRRVAARVPSEAELTEIGARLSRRALRWAIESAAVTREVAERIAVGGRATALLVPPLLTPMTIGELAREVIGGRAGALRLFEVERRPLGEERRTLGNGVTVSWRWISGDAAMMAVALGGVAEGVAQESLSAVATAAADRGWLGQVTDLLGTQTAALAVPAGDLVEALEIAAEVLRRGSAPEGSRHDTVVADLGLAPTVSAEAVSLALALPEGADEALEAVDKFFSAIPTRGVHSEALAVGAPLRWTQAGPPAQIAAVVPLPADASGLVAGQILLDRLPRHSGLTARWLSSPGQPALLVSATEVGEVPNLDNRLAALWDQMRRAPSGAEMLSAARALALELYGDALRAVARSAAAPFLAELPSTEVLLAVEPAETAAALGGLPLWRELRRDARGPAPEHPRDVRESRPRPRRRS